MGQSPNEPSPTGRCIVYDDCGPLLDELRRMVKERIAAGKSTDWPVGVHPSHIERLLTELDCTSGKRPYAVTLGDDGHTWTLTAAVLGRIITVVAEDSCGSRWWWREPDGE